MTVPAARGGWWHAYVCPTHAVELDPVDPGRPDHRCRHGCVFTGEPYTSAWVALDHQRTVRRIRLLAARAGSAGAEAEAADEAITMVAAYADAYLAIGPGDHDGAAEWMVPGRLFHQALSESIWAAGIAGAVWTLAERVDVERTARLAEAAEPLLTALHDTAVVARERTELRSNYVAWFDAAGALCAGALQRLGATPAPDPGWIDGPAGIHAHLRAAVLDDGWQWEGSTYYHAFVLLAALSALRGTDPADLPADIGRTLRGMVAVLGGLAGSDGVLPSLHDSPYRRSAGDEDLRTEHQVTEVCELAEVVGLVRGLVDATTAERLDPLAAWCRQVLAGRDEEALLDPPAGWFAGPPPAYDDGDRDGIGSPPAGSSILFDKAGYAVIRPSHRRWRAVLDFGPHGGSHGHLDKLALYVQGDGTAWQPDPGVTPYASRLRTDVYRTVRAHPAFSVDGAEQAEGTGRLVRWADDGRSVVVAADDSYPGVRARRRLHIVDDDTLLDIVEIDADRECDLTVHLRPAVPVRVHADDTGGRVHWNGAVPLVTGHACSAAARLVMVPGWSPADDPTRPQSWVDWTATASSAVFATVWQFGPDSVDRAVVVTAGTRAVELHRTSHPTVVQPLGDPS